MARAEIAPYRGIPKQRCSAHSSKTGNPCRRWANIGSAVCNSHGGASPQVRRKAAARIEASLDKAAKAVVELMTDERTPPAVRLACARDLLDRGGMTGATHISATRPTWEVIYDRILVRADAYADDEPQDVVLGEVVDAEIVE